MKLSKLADRPWILILKENLAVMTITHTDSTDLHAHQFLELVMVLDGESTHLFHNEKRKISRGDILLIPVGMEHGYMDPINLEIINVLFDAGKYGDLHRLLGEIPGFHALFTVDTELRMRRSHTRGCFLHEAALLEAVSHILRVADELYEDHPGWKTASHTAFIDFLIYVTRNLGKNSHNPDAPYMRAVPAVQYMEENLHRPPTLHEIAEEIGMSSSTLLRTFKSTFGLTPMSYLRNLRIRRAAEVLVQSDNPISYIADAFGFNDSAHFSHLFRDQYGVTPSDYRKGKQYDRSDDQQTPLS
jgi:AraC family transcriptional regulator, L-rhamnose operon regulatory protein RhaS